MITKEQIENAASKHGKIYNDPWNFECEIAKESFIVGVEWALEQCPYSREDMIDLLHFVRLSAPNWIIPDDKLVKHWEEQK